MILKKLKRKCLTRPKGAMIRGLIDYILQPQDESGKEKMVWYGAKNFLAETKGGQKAEMVALASESIQSKMPVSHWILSWQENEQPSHEQIDEAVDVFLEKMGLEGHQVIYALHGNTDNFHVHIAVNRTHPDTLKVIQPHKGFDIEEAHRIVAWLEHIQGWASENNPRYMVDDQGDIVRRQRTAVIKPQEKAANFESATGEKSAQRIAQERGHAVIRNATSWKELHEGLAKAGLRFEKKGSGAIVFVGDMAVKASAIDRNFGLSKLCKRLGDFIPGNYAPMKKSEPEPVSTVAIEEWKQYRKVCQQENMERLERKKREADVIFQARVRQRDERQAALDALARHGIYILNIARHFLKVQHKAELQALRERPKSKKRLCFKNWLARSSKRLAKIWKLRRCITTDMQVEKFTFPKISSLAAPYTTYREIVKKRHPEKVDESRLDSIAALYMRCAGYTYQEVGNAIHKELRPLRKAREHRDWKGYLQRIINYSFGSAGDIDIAAFKPTPEKILAFQREAEKLEAERQAAAKKLESIFTFPACQDSQRERQEEEPRQWSGMRM